MIFNSDNIHTFFEPHVFDRGVAIHHQKRVHRLNMLEDASHIEAEVIDPQKKPFHVVIRNTVEKNKPHSYAQCTCPKAYQCEHIVATLITAIKYLETANIPPVEQHIAWLEKLSQTADKQVASNTNHWLAFLSPGDKQPPPKPSHSKSTYVLLYRLDLTLSTPQTLNLTLGVSKQTKKGGYGPIQKCFSCDTASHFKALLPIDHDILHKIETLTRIQGSCKTAELYQSRYTLPETLEPSVLKQLIGTGRCFWNESLLLHLGKPQKGALQWQVQNFNEQILICTIQDNPIQVLPLSPLWYLNPTNGETGILELPGDPMISKTLIFSPPLAPPAVSKVSTMLTAHFKTHEIPLPHQFKTQVVPPLLPKPRLRLLGIKPHNNTVLFHLGSENPTGLVIPIGRMSFLYGNTEIPLQAEKTVYSLNTKTNILTQSLRQLPLEGEHITQLLTEYPVSIFHERYPYIFNPELQKTDFLIGILGKTDSQTAFLQESVPLLKALGWDIICDRSFPADYIIESDEWYTELSTSDYNWFNMEVGVIVDNQKINILPLVVKLIQQTPNAFTEAALNTLSDEHLTISLENHQKIRMPKARIKGILATLTELYDGHSLTGDHLSLCRSRVSQLKELTKVMELKKMQWLGGDALIALSEKIANFNGIRPVETPQAFKGTLRDYQKKGVDWLNFLREYQLGGILADDMGLGKTVQTLAHLMIEKVSGRLNKPCLIIAPTSLMENWRSEAAQFAPSLKLITSQGQSRKHLQAELPAADLILTTYPLIVRDETILLKHEYYMIILDEAQFIKNSNSKAYLILQKFKAAHRLCLTGTPMENHLGELWSLFNFLSPGLLGNSRQFTQLFRTPIEKQGNVERKRSLNQRIRPYILRRTKAEVVQELPTKTEIVHHIDLEEKQRDLYESIRLAMEAKIQKAVNAKGFAQSQIIILDALLKLRQASADPRLLKLEQAKNVQESAKLSFLMNMLSELVEEGRKILLFSSFTSMLSLIEQALQKENITYVKLTGNTVDRKTPIQSFQTGEVPVFLISLKAGGTGLNLTAADTVIFYDPWWNPAAEAQAADRAHRIGQEKPVFVYKLVATGTVEEKILVMQQNKRALMESLFEEGKVTQAFSKEDLDFLFQPIEQVGA